MRPLRLDLAGFTVFREPTTIDLTDVDFFALVGPTGSGKSTVLDAICFALYGTVPRWNDRRAIANALAPSATEARVRLAFEAAGSRYVLTRVVRRDGKGAVSTRQAGLEALPPGFDLTRLDAAPGERDLDAADLGEVLAGTPGEVDTAVAEVIGLPYEQFTKCVVVPQGEFAAFMHAKPAERQRILVNLLGVEVYGRIRERAGAEAAAAEAKATAADQVLTGLADADDAAVDAARAAVARLTGLVADVDLAMPALAAAATGTARAQGALDAVDATVARLAEVRVPASAAGLAADVTEARAAVTAATAGVASAEEREEKLRAQLAAAPDPAALRRLLDAHTDAERLAAEAQRLAGALHAARGGRAAAATAAAAAAELAATAREELEAARAGYQAAMAADRAAALRRHLHPGDSCPVCEQPVATVPAVPPEPAVTAAEAAGAAARQAADAADRQAADRQAALRDADLDLARVTERSEQLAARTAEVEQRLRGAPSAEVLRTQLAALTGLQRDLATAADAVRAARSAARRAAVHATGAEERLRTGWLGFDAVRDGLAGLGPPAALRDDLAAAWAALAGWAATELAGHRTARLAAVEALTAARRAAEDATDRVDALFTAAGLPAPSAAHGRAGTAPGPAPNADPVRAAAVALERAEAEVRRLVERRADAKRLRGQRADAEREATVARALAGHLRADRFERWLLTEALDALVDGASRILRELSGGQYDLGHDKGEFFVIDHHDAGLRRAVRTLSGGETFQASLSLALALSEQLAGSSAAGASLESILLDEGFGTLDAATLETVATTLESLAARGDRMVGVVTHVGALAERVPVRFEVRRDARTATVERVGL